MTHDFAITGVTTPEQYYQILSKFENNMFTVPSLDSINYYLSKYSIVADIGTACHFMHFTLPERIPSSYETLDFYTLFPKD